MDNTSGNLYCNQGFKNLICSDKINNEYLFWFLKGKKEFLNSLDRGATFKEISKRIVKDIEITIPDIDKQKCIVRIVKKCYEIINLRKKELEKLDRLIKARFVERFGDINKNDKGWDSQQLGELCKIGRAHV